jgi:hypothetical protein
MPGACLLNTQVWLLWVDLGLLVIVGMVWMVRQRKRLSGQSDLLGLAAVGLLALGLRIFVSPHTLVHENAHGYEYLRSAFSLEGYFYHGSGYYAFFHLLTRVFGRLPEVVFYANAVLGAASAVILVPLGRRLLGSREGAWFTAIAYACLPAALRIGGSESMFGLAVFFGLLSWLTWLRAWDRGSAWLFVASAGLLAYAVQVRPVMALWPAVLLLSLPLCRGWTRRLRSPWPWVSLAVLIGLLSGWLIFRIRVFTGEGLPEVLRLAPGDFMGGFFSGNNLLCRFDWTPALILVFAPAGLLFLVKRRRALPALLVGYLLMAWPVMGITTGESSSLRLQSLLHPFILLWAGLGAAKVADLTGQRWRIGFMALTGLLLLASSMARTPQVSRFYNPQHEYAFLERETEKLPAGCAIVTADRFMARRIISTEFPYWWAEGRPVEELSDHLADPDALAGWPCLVFYRGLSCYLFTHHERDRLPPGKLPLYSPGGDSLPQPTPYLLSCTGRHHHPGLLPT